MNPPQGRPTVAEVRVAALRHNLRQVRSLVAPGIDVLAVVKANAYGHGAVVAARAFVEEGAAVLGVATLGEAEELRAAGLQTPILLMGGVARSEADAVIDLELTPAVWDVESSRALAERASARGRRVAVHLKVDTGMSRLGVAPAEAAALGRELSSLPGLLLEGVFSHFACAEDVRGPFSSEQLRRFSEVVTELEAVGVRPRHRHLANSAAVLAPPETPSTFRPTLVRPGIMLYGVSPDPALAGRADLAPAMRFRTSIVQLRRVPTDTPVSYGQTFRTRRPSLLATLPVGYADGYVRSLSNRGEVLVRSRRAPVVGRVCMDLTVVDVSDVGGVSLGDEVVLWGSQGDAMLPCGEVAARADTIPYELLVGVGPRVPRIQSGS